MTFSLPASAVVRQLLSVPGRRAPPPACVAIPIPLHLHPSRNHSAMDSTTPVTIDAEGVVREVGLHEVTGG